ncbi:MAG: diguanylate cyclase [Magnetococcales bacterium]|nr:diguanylate cyclase [Magnetococcales bacterium]
MAKGKMSIIKSTVLLPFVSLLTILVCGGSVGVYWQQDSHNQQQWHNVANDIQDTMKLVQQADAVLMSAAASAIQRVEAVRNAYLQRDRSALYRLVQELFQELNVSSRITHFYFHQPDRINFMRVHQPDRHGDLISRHTLRMAQQSGQAVTGLEMGPLGTLALRCVVPWYHERQLIGFVEIGKEIDQELSVIAAIHQVDLHLLVDKKQLNRSDWQVGQQMLGKQTDWDAFDHHVLIHTTATDAPHPRLLPFLSAASTGLQRLHDRSIDYSHFNIISRPLANVVGQEIATLVAVQDVTSQVRQSRRAVALVLVLGLVSAAGLTLLGWRLLERLERKLNEAEERESAERQRHEQTILASENLFRSITASAQDAMIMVDDTESITLWNRSATRIFQYDEQEAIGSNLHDLIAPARFLEVARIGFQQFVASGTGNLIGRTIELWGRRKNGEEFPFELSTAAVLRDGHWHAVGILRDISQRKQAEQQLKLGFSVIEHAAEGIIITSTDGIIQMVNPAVSRITGFSVEDLVGHSPRLLRSGRHRDAFYQEMWQTIKAEGIWRGEIWNRRKSGESYPEWLSISAIFDSHGTITNYVGIFSDITQRKQFEGQLERLAFYDALTAIPNRMLFSQSLVQAIREAQRRNEIVAVLYFDLDLFKRVNDTHGHAIGDMLLQETAQRLLSVLPRKEDLVARLGGDEFAVILRAIQQPADAAQVAEKIIEVLTQPFYLHDIECRIGASIGISHFPAQSTEPDRLVEMADAAMYRSKKGGRNRYHFYDSWAVTKG